jgi:hypothetical protein
VIVCAILIFIKIYIRAIDMAVGSADVAAGAIFAAGANFAAGLALRARPGLRVPRDLWA